MKKAVRKILSRNLQLLNDWQSDLVEIVVYLLQARKIYTRAHPFTRLALWYVPVTFTTLMAFPPAHTVPPVAVPIVAAASLCLAYILSALFRLHA